MRKYRPLSFKKVKRYSLRERKSKVELTKFSRPLPYGGTFLEFINSLSDILAARDFKEVVRAIVNSRNNNKHVILGMGAHPIKVGLSPVIIELVQKGIITAIAVNGAAIVHDFEIAYVGHTSEDVASELRDGSFGMARETGVLLNRAIKKGAEKGIGLGRAIGELISQNKGFPYRDKSIFAEAYRLSIPVTVHVAIGTDIIHMHPDASGEAIGKTSYTDFKIFSSIVSDLDGGVFINLGSAVIIPEVFLKALTVARNLKKRVENITTLTMDFDWRYRPMMNVVQRPTLTKGKGYYLIGHHELMFPLLAGAVKELLSV